MTDLQLLDDWIDTYNGFIDPFKFRELQRRALVWCIEFLPDDKKQAKAVMRGRLAKFGRYTGDAEIEAIADRVARLESLRSDLQRLNMADAHKVTPVLDEMSRLSAWLLDYYR